MKGENMELPTITVDVKHMSDGKFDVWIEHEGSSGSHYEHVTSTDIGRLVKEEVDDIVENGYV